MIDEELIDALLLSRREIVKQSIMTEEKQYAVIAAASMLAMTKGKFYIVENVQGRNKVMDERGDELPEYHPDYMWIMEQAQRQILGEVDEVEVKLNALR